MRFLLAVKKGASASRNEDLKPIEHVYKDEGWAKWVGTAQESHGKEKLRNLGGWQNLLK